ncbi:uncharacterized protein LOC111026973 [Myzus persicae]|uniref:uncharacterized protein LOC111026973 n=1 Tax=Myzus persicae TaxID=13164 RepID=UPI000B92FA08|nr:uncharacterized protein LOC111026973 [Myzus persicae]
MLTRLSRRLQSTRALTVGDRVVISKRVEKSDINDFARLSGDTNPIHSGDRPLVHGIYLAGLVSGVIGTKLPGDGTVVVSKKLRFPNACYAGDLVKIEVEIQTIRKLVKCGFWCRVGDKVVMEGTADVINKRLTKNQTCNNAV